MRSDHLSLSRDAYSKSRAQVTHTHLFQETLLLKSECVSGHQRSDVMTVHVSQRNVICVMCCIANVTFVVLLFHELKVNMKQNVHCTICSR